MPPTVIPHQGFYEAGATVIPVLFLALLFQLRWFESEGRKSPRLALFDLGIIVVAIVGEIVCLTALSDDRTPTELEKEVVICAITLMFLPIIFRALLPRVKAITETWPRFPGIAQAVFFTFIVVGIVVLLVAHVRFVVILAVGAILFLFVAVGGQGVAEDWEKGRLDFLKRKHRGSDTGDDDGK